MSRWVIIASCLTLATSCYVAASLEEDTDGTRLRRPAFVTETGEILVRASHFRDLELDTDCGFLPASDGRIRCYPRPAYAERVFLDDACREPAMIVPDGCPAPRFHLEPVASDSCADEPTRSRVLDVSAEASELDRVFVSTAGGCLVREGAVRVWPLSPADPARFVAADVVRGPDLGGPLTVDRLRAEDGTRAAWRLRDRARDALCVHGAGADREPCLPQALAPLRTRTMSACGAEWLPGPGETRCGAPPYVMQRVGCERARVLAYEAADDEEALACGLAPNYRRVISADESVPWVRRVWRGSGRLQVASSTDDDGRELGHWGFSGPFWDRELETQCMPMPTRLGRRCVPWGDVGAGPHFADPECTEPALPADAAGCPPRFVRASSRVGACAWDLEVEAVYRVAEPIEVVHRLDPDSGSCVALEVGGYALRAVPLESLVRLEPVDDAP